MLRKGDADVHQRLLGTSLGRPPVELGRIDQFTTFAKLTERPGAQELIWNTCCKLLLAADVHLAPVLGAITTRFCLLNATRNLQLLLATLPTCQDLPEGTLIAVRHVVLEHPA